MSADPDQRLGDLWLTRLRQVLDETYAGVPLFKFPEDLRVYEHLLWEARVDVVIELGTFHGGSALWFRDRMRTFKGYGRTQGARVISVDIDVSLARRDLPAADPLFERDITLVEGDMEDPALPARVAAHVPPGSSCLVVEDGPHTYEATTAALRGYAHFVAPGSYFVVEDGVVDEPRLRAFPFWPRGVQPAIRDWLSTPQGRDFSPAPELEAYGITTNLGGYLKRRA